MEGLQGPRSAAEQAIEYLLNRNFLLTALELVQEAGEAGLAHEVEHLIQFFKNPALFPPEKVAACNPENGALFVQVAHQRQQELSQARYELALAREQLAALSGGGARQEAAAEQQGAAGAPPQLQQPGGGPRPTTCKDEEEDAGAQLSPAQLRALHGAVLAHLQAQGFRVAALSLSKEAQLPPPRGADSQAPSAAASLAGMYAAAQQLAAQSARLRDLEVQAEQQGRELAAARQLLEESRGREAAAAAEVDFLRGRLAAMEQAQQAQQAQQVQQQRDEEQQRQQAPPAGQQPPPGQAPPAPSGEGAERGATLAFGSLGATGALEEVAACMPRVLPNVLINKREELVPALCALCQEHPQAAGRRQLAGLLFGLIKRPNEAQRGLIARACVALAGRIGPGRTLLELAPHLEEQVRHEAMERRLLVAEATGALAPHLPPAQAAPTVLRLLEALLQDSQPQVRCQALSSIERLTATLPHDAGSFSHVLRLLLGAAADGSGDVAQRLLQSTLPAVLDWVGHSELMVTQLLPQTLRRLRDTLQQFAPEGGAPEALHLEAPAGYRRNGAAGVEGHAGVLLQIYSASLPAVRELALGTQPSWVAQAAQATAGQPGAAALPRQPAMQQGTAAAAADASLSAPDSASPGSPGPGSRPGSSAGSRCDNAAADGVQRWHTTGGASPPGAPAPREDSLEAVRSQQAGAPPLIGVQEGTLTAPRPDSTASSPNGVQPAGTVQPGSSSSPAAAAGQPEDDGSDALQPMGARQAGNSCPTHLQLEQGSAAPATGEPAAAGQPGATGSSAALQRRLEAAAFAAWVRGGGRLEDWQALDYIAVSAVPELLGAALLAATLPEAPLLSQRFVAALKATCLSFGEPFAAAVVVPQLHAAAGIPAWSNPAAGTSSGPDNAARTDAHAGARLHARLAQAGLLAAPAAPARQALQPAAALALLLAGVLPYAGASAVGACLRRLCTDGGSGSGALWALQHPRPFVAAVRAAAEVQLVQAQLVPLMWELVASRQPGPRLAAALLAGAAAPALPKQQVTRQLLPLLSTLGCDRDPAACSASVAAAAVVFGCLGGEPDVQEALFSTLDDVLIAGGHAAEMALLAALAPRAPRATSQQLEWLLQRLLLMLAAMHQRGSCGKSPAQLAEAAATAFVSLRQIEAHEFAEQRLHMHFAAALTALQREADLLDQPQRDALAAMIEDHEAPAASSAGSTAHGAQLPPHSAAPATPTHHAAPPWPAGLQGPAPGGRGSALLAALFAGGGCLGPEDDLPISAFVGSLGQARDVAP